MHDPFKIDSPTCLTFSMGRSSAYMLWRVLQANDGLPSCAVVLCCNTGKEDPQSLEFWLACTTRWNVPIVGLEYRKGPGFAVVDFASAARNGEPFSAVIEHRGHILPNVRSPYCSSELKTRTMHRYLRSIGWTEWDTMLGIRADEPARVARFRANPSPEVACEEIRMPLADAGITKYVVGTFWRSMDFDLRLPNINGETPLGNCDLCFKKKGARVMSIVRDTPSKAVWWLNEESVAAEHAEGDGAFFRNDRPSYAAMHANAINQCSFAFDPGEETVDCLCGD
jgi:hypothetical protein